MRSLEECLPEEFPPYECLSSDWGFVFDPDQFVHALEGQPYLSVEPSLSPAPGRVNATNFILEQENWFYNYEYPLFVMVRHRARMRRQWQNTTGVTNLFTART